MKIIDNSAPFIATPIKGYELLIGCGNARKKMLSIDGKKDTGWKDLKTLDMDPRCNPDVLWDLNNLPLPFVDESFHEIHAYEVLEHIGKQGDWRAFFDQFTEFHRILKPDGHFFATVPMWDCEWAWGDPGHTRVITPGTLTFLQQSAYESDVGRTAMTDYRSYYKVDWELIGAQEANQRLCFVLKKK